MDVLKNKKYISADYKSRYIGRQYAYNTLVNREIMFIGMPMFTNTDWVAHTVTNIDTLEKLALKYYNNPTYWWVIMYFNKIPDAFENITKYKVLKIPNIASVKFGNDRH